MRIRLEGLKGIGRRLSIEDDKGFVVAIFLALLIVFSVVIGYFVFLRPPAEPYNTMYLLDSQNKAADYATTLVANQNSTFNTQVCVVNHLGATQSYQVQTKITKNLSLLPLSVEPAQVYDITDLPDGQTSQKTVTITLNEPGSYTVVFELYRNNNGALAFDKNYCVLKIEVTK